MESREQHASTAPEPTSEVRAIIEREAWRRRVHPRAALLFAELESGFNPHAYGASDWASTHPDEWHALRRRMPCNLAIDDPTAWGRYGLFGLLAAYHVYPDEHPRVLSDPAVNAARGIPLLKRTLDSAGGDVRSARRFYVGCGLDGSLCSAERLAELDARLTAAARRWLER